MIEPESPPLLDRIIEAFHNTSNGWLTLANGRQVGVGADFESGDRMYAVVYDSVATGPNASCEYDTLFRTQVDDMDEAISEALKFLETIDK